MFISYCDEPSTKNKRDLLKGMLDKFIVHQEKNKILFDLNFNIPLVNDKLKYLTKDKKKGYEIVNGKKELVLDLDFDGKKLN